MAVSFNTLQIVFLFLSLSIVKGSFILRYFSCYNPNTTRSSDPRSRRVVPLRQTTRPVHDPALFQPSRSYDSFSIHELQSELDRIVLDEAYFDHIKSIENDIFYTQEAGSYLVLGKIQQFYDLVPMHLEHFKAHFDLIRKVIETRLNRRHFIPNSFLREYLVFITSLLNDPPLNVLSSTEAFTCYGEMKRIARLLIESFERVEFVRIVVKALALPYLDHSDLFDLIYFQMVEVKTLNSLSLDQRIHRKSYLKRTFLLLTEFIPLPTSTIDTQIIVNTFNLPQFFHLLLKMYPIYRSFLLLIYDNKISDNIAFNTDNIPKFNLSLPLKLQTTTLSLLNDFIKMSRFTTLSGLNDLEFQNRQRLFKAALLECIPSDHSEDIHNLLLLLKKYNLLALFEATVCFYPFTDPTEALTVFKTLLQDDFDPKDVHTCTLFCSIFLAYNPHIAFTSIPKDSVPKLPLLILALIIMATKHVPLKRSFLSLRDFNRADFPQKASSLIFDPEMDMKCDDLFLVGQIYLVRQYGLPFWLTRFQPNLEENASWEDVLFFIEFFLERELNLNKLAQDWTGMIK